MSAEPNFARPFTDADWQGYLGAEEFEYKRHLGLTDGELQPVIRYWDGFDIVCCKGLTEAHNYSDACCDDYLRFPACFPTQLAALAFLNGLPESLSWKDLNGYGFE